MKHPNPARGALRLRAVVVSGFVLVAALSRLIPHPPNFTPVGAMALFGGAYFASRWAAIGVPLVAMAISDLALEITMGDGLHSLLPVVYGCFALTTFLGMALRSRVRPATVLGASVTAATLFFLVTNFAVWARGSLYPIDASGLLQCYVAALPFYGNTLAGHVLYSFVLFGGFRLVERRYKSLNMPADARA